MNLKKISKTLSFGLRHEPGEIGIELDEKGWVEIDSLLDSLEEDVTKEDIEKIVEKEKEEGKGRYEIESSKIRATYGHSVDKVNICKNEEEIPDILFHGTPKENISSIKHKGLKPMNRNEVHLTDDIEEAKNVGKRKSSNIKILRIHTNGLDINKRGNKIYVVDGYIPSSKITF